MEEPGGNLSESNIFDCSILAFKFFFSISSLSLRVIMAKRDDSPPPYGIHFRSDGSVSASAGFQASDIHPYTLQLLQALSRMGTFGGGGGYLTEQSEEKALLMPRRVQQAAVRVVKLKLRRTAARRKIRRSSRSRIRRRVKGREKSFRLAKTATTSFDFKQRSLES